MYYRDGASNEQRTERRRLRVQFGVSILLTSAPRGQCREGVEEEEEEEEVVEEEVVVS